MQRPDPARRTRRSDSWRGTAAGVGVSVALHAALAITVFMWISSRTVQRPMQVQTAMSIELAPAPSSPPAPPNETPPMPPQPTVIPPKTQDFPDLPKIAAPDAITLPVKPAPPPRLRQQPPPSPPSAPALPPAAVAAAPSVGQPQNGRTTTEQNWEGRVLARLERMKRYPGDAMQQGLEDIIYVRLTLDRQGHVVASTIVKSHGHAVLDNAVLYLVKRASPLPALPASIAGATYTFVVPVDFFLKKSNR
jgi:periplasmic protein TonB